MPYFGVDVEFEDDDVFEEAKRGGEIEHDDDAKTIKIEIARSEKNMVFPNSRW